MFQSFDDLNLSQHEYQQQDSPPERNYQYDYDEYGWTEKSMIRLCYDQNPNINSPYTLHKKKVLYELQLNSMCFENLEEENQSPSQNSFHFINDACSQRPIACNDSSQILVEGQQKNAHEQENLFIDTNSTYHIKDQYTQSLCQALEGEDPSKSKWVCKLCQKRCSSQGAITNHLKVIHFNLKKSDKFLFNIYDYILNRRSPRGRVKGSKTIKQSEKKKSNYKCSSCFQSFTQYGGLKSHIQIVHKIVEQKEIKRYFTISRGVGRPPKNDNKIVETIKRKRGRPQKIKFQQI
ncbi:zinc finger, C2H2 type protein (macronuclear) [Tetrahymena thermophila SB210]|uniref:Zinc finger, C2H2 type protein n=1 Tax=Tetrahymena thermophila (strain SB210) TaxID=312017 RepID=I7MJ91_TETTS|nr:zinc finger, C2H2 type protein [Tetrahymena thermophila SB210]EAR96084.1 zinc finger, C2H2 type protein [Tetrahymena thermophila SB210]|eukprot:XP_001016329.1 zinc finger, C2H2 type protein [Tetrahymena thermophila SB210]